LSPVLLPEKIKMLQDDPYRSLAWLVRKNGGYKKTAIPFAEFKWARYFRKKIKLSGKKHAIKDALPLALELARDPEAENLPGYIGK